MMEFCTFIINTAQLDSTLSKTCEFVFSLEKFFPARVLWVEAESVARGKNTIQPQYLSSWPDCAVPRYSHHYVKTL